METNLITSNMRAVYEIILKRKIKTTNKKTPQFHYARMEDDGHDKKCPL